MMEVDSSGESSLSTNKLDAIQLNPDLKIKEMLLHLNAPVTVNLNMVSWDNLVLVVKEKDQNELQTIVPDQNLRLSVKQYVTQKENLDPQGIMPLIRAMKKPFDSLPFKYLSPRYYLGESEEEKLAKKQEEETRIREEEEKRVKEEMIKRQIQEDLRIIKEEKEKIRIENQKILENKKQFKQEQEKISKERRRIEKEKKEHEQKEKERLEEEEKIKKEKVSIQNERSKNRQREREQQFKEKKEREDSEKKLKEYFAQEEKRIKSLEDDTKKKKLQEKEEGEHQRLKDIEQSQYQNLCNLYLKSGAKITKYKIDMSKGKSSSSLGDRWLWYTNPGLKYGDGFLCWSPSSDRKRDPKKSISISSISSVIPGKSSISFATNSYSANVADSQCFTVIAPNVRLDIATSSERERSMLVNAIQYLQKNATEHRFLHANYFWIDAKESNDEIPFELNVSENLEKAYKKLLESKRTLLLSTSKKVIKPPRQLEVKIRNRKFHTDLTQMIATNYFTGEVVQIVRRAEGSVPKEPVVPVLNPNARPVFNDPDSELCTVCLEIQRDVTLVPCGHICLCMNCATIIKTSRGICPLCNVAIRDLVKFYKS